MMPKPLVISPRYGGAFHVQIGLHILGTTIPEKVIDAVRDYLDDPEGAQERLRIHIERVMHLDPLHPECPECNGKRVVATGATEGPAFTICPRCQGFGYLRQL